MNSDYSLKRHSQLWEDQNKQIKRVFIGALFVAYLLLTNILTPYSNRLDEINNGIKQTTTQMEQIQISWNDLARLERALTDIQKIIGQQPWMAEKDKLVRKYREMNVLGGADRETYQRLADSTVSAIGSQVLQNVSEPLKEFMNISSFDALTSELTSELRGLPRVVEQWTQENRGRLWYGTLDEKATTVQSLTTSLQDHLQTISRGIEQEKPHLEEKRGQLKTKKNVLIQMKAEEEKQLPIKLDAEMKKILPNWIGGIITVRQIMLYPFVVLGIVFYIAVSAAALTNHYRFMARGLGVENDGRSDSAFSSLWTLTYRGRMGTLLTLATYIAFITAMWFFFEQGFTIFNKWQSAESGGMSDKATLQAELWIGRLILSSLLIFIAGRPFYRRGN